MFGDFYFSYKVRVEELFTSLKYKLYLLIYYSGKSRGLRRVIIQKYHGGERVSIIIH